MKNTTRLLVLLLCFVVVLTWFPYPVRAEEDDIIIDVSTIWSSGTHTYGNVLITTGVTLTLDGTVTLNCSNLTIESGAAISADGKGYAGSTGPGRGGDAVDGSSGGGAGYGGSGGSTFDGAGGVAYGFMTEPTDLGSGGGKSGAAGLGTPTPSPGGAGGGAIKLEVSDTLTINGTISANGVDGSVAMYLGSPVGGGGGGSGGSIYITAKTLEGSGVITANGGNGGNARTYDGGGGAGGRIAIYYDTNNFSGAIGTYGGQGQQNGGAGTIYSKSSTQVYGDLLVDNGGNQGVTTIIFGTLECINVSNGAHVLVEAESNLNISELILNSATLTNEGNSIVSNYAEFDSATLNNLDGEVFLQTVSMLGIVIINGQLLCGDIVVTSGSTLTHSAVVDIKTYWLEVSATNLTIESGAAISADGKGYAGSTGPGRGGDAVDGSDGGGAGYGGNGGSAFDGAGGVAYGSMTEPTDLGSGGGKSGAAGLGTPTPSPGGSGGGAIKLEVSDILTINGTISANGVDGGRHRHLEGYYYACGGGGSGGSIYIMAQALTGNGSITANGGNGGDGRNYDGGGGAGGRIAIYYDTNTFSGVISTYGGQGQQNGGDGTIYSALTSSDTIPPDAVNDLAVSQVNTDSIQLTWTAPGDDGNVGTALEYDIRYSTSEITEANWDSATQCTGEPTPQPAGSSENFTVTGLTPDTTYYFAIKTGDEVPNWSGLSNVVSGTTAQTTVPFLQFPLSGKTPWNAAINAVFDHSMSSPYTADDVVVAYTGEKGEREFGADYVTTIGGVDLYGFRNSSGSYFTVNGNYTGDDFLYYDGHPGYDFRTVDQGNNVPVLAAASGTGYRSSDDYGIVYIDHANGYRTYYMHLDNESRIANGTLVTAGEQIGIAGSTGAVHLHFEVRKNVGGQWVAVDAYGWQGIGVDPYFTIRGVENVNLWLDAAVNQRPVAYFTYSPESPFNSGEVVFFDASSSHDPDGTITSYVWDFGDGETATGVSCSHRFRGKMNESKTYTVTLTVEDNSGATATNSCDINVIPLEKTVEVTHEPTIPVPDQPVYARVTILYNWIHDDTYVVSRIRYESGGFAGIGTVSIWDFHSHEVPMPKWAADIFSFGSENQKIYTPILEEVHYGGDIFQGIEVDAYDAMNIYIAGWAGISISTSPSLPAPFFETNSVCFQPDYTEAPDMPVEAPNLDLAYICSPGELRVYDSEGRVTGLENGEVKEGIPQSAYNDGTIIIICSSPSSYKYEVEGTGEGSYGLVVASVENGEITSFTATDIPTAEGEIHQYTIDWGVLSEGGDGVIVQIDTDGDGDFERTVSADKELTVDEFWPYSFTDSQRGTKLRVDDTNQTFQFIAPDKEFPIKKAIRMKIIDFSKEKEPPVKYDSHDKKWKLDGKRLDLDRDLRPFTEQHQFNHRPDKIILINHRDSDLQLSAVVVDGKEDSCMAFAKDLKTKKTYLLIVKPELKKPKLGDWNRPGKKK